jgi:hypothetical protein
LAEKDDENPQPISAELGNLEARKYFTKAVLFGRTLINMATFHQLCLFEMAS